MLDSFYKGKRVFVTGHTGFKGAWLSAWLLRLGADVYGFSDGIPTRPSLFEQLELGETMRSQIGDVRDFSQIDGALREADPQIIFHLAAQSLVRPSYDHPVETFATNAMGTVHILESLRRLKNLESGIFVTSDKCYMNNETGRPFVEDDPMGGDDPYSASKGAAEIIFHSYFKSFFSKSAKPGLMSVRAGNVIGGGDWAVDRIIPDAIRAWSSGQAVEIRSPHSIRPWQHVLEPLYGYLLAARTAATDSSRHGCSYNFGPGLKNEKTVMELIEQLARSCEFAKGWQVNSGGASQKSEAQVLRLNVDRVERDLRWKSLMDFSETIEWTGLWYNQLQKKPASIREFTLSQLSQFESKVAGL